MIDFVRCKVLVGNLPAWIEAVGAARRWSADRRDKASAAFRSAVVETQVYLGALERGERDRAVEADLARRWSAVSQTIRTLDADIEQRAFDLSEYWTSPPTSPAEGAQLLWQRLTKLADDGRSRGFTRNS